MDVIKYTKKIEECIKYYCDMILKQYVVLTGKNIGKCEYCDNFNKEGVLCYDCSVTHKTKAVFSTKFNKLPLLPEYKFGTVKNSYEAYEEVIKCLLLYRSYLRRVKKIFLDANIVDLEFEFKII